MPNRLEAERGSLVGAVVTPALSDRQGKRRRYLMVAVVGAIPGLLGLTFATSPVLLYASAAVLGFFLVSALPVGMQYGAEITQPAAANFVHLDTSQPPDALSVGKLVHDPGGARPNRCRQARADGNSA